MVRCAALKRLSIVLGSVGLLAGCGQILGLGDYEVGEETASAGGTGGTTGGDSGNGGGGSGGDAGNGGGANGGSAGSPDGGSAGVGTVTTTAGGGNAGMGGGGTTSTISTTTTTGMGGSAGAGPCECDTRDPCLTGECDAEGVCIPRELGAECLSGNFGGVCDDTQQCVPCVDDAPDTEVDSGCPETAPECDDSGTAPECTGCTEDIHCDDDIDCTADTCDDGRCARAVLPAGAECSEGVCNGAGAAESCVPCVDNQATGMDAGCEAALPLCDTSQSPAACVECLAPEDCNDDNDCTTETCEDKQCGSETVTAGVECLGGVCSGIPGSESCGACLDTAPDNGVDQGCTADAPVCDMTQVPPACTGCDDNTDCDDEIDCTTDTCNGSQVCVHTPDDSVCAASGDVCMPNQCVMGMGCTGVDVTQSLSLLADGGFDSGGNVWVETSSGNFDIVVIEGTADAGYLLADTPTRYAWLGGAFDEASEIWQVIDVPEGTQSLTLTFRYYLSSDDIPYYLDHSQMGAALLSSDGGTILHEFLHVANQDETNAWGDFTETIDATDWAGTQVRLYFWAQIGSALYYYYGYPDYYGVYLGRSSFFVDTTALTADVCQ